MLESDSGEREMSTTMAFVRILMTRWLRDKSLGTRIVPIVPDESRTFGMEGMFRQVRHLLARSASSTSPWMPTRTMMFYKESKTGQLSCRKASTKRASMASFTAAATSYSNHGVSMIPMSTSTTRCSASSASAISAWAAGDSQARGFLVGGTSGRTTLNGEGLQHEDGHSHLMSATIPNCVSYDPTYAYEVAVIIQDGLRRMIQEQEDVFYYLTTLNENYRHPAMPEGAEEGIVKGMYLIRPSQKTTGAQVQLMGSGAMLNEALAAAELLEKDFGLQVDVWSVTSFTELRREAMDVERWNMLHPLEEGRVPYVTRKIREVGDGPVVATTDYMKLFADQIRAYVPNPYKVLGTDGFGRSDYRKKLREHFEVDRRFVAVAALKALAETNKAPSAAVQEAIEKYKINPDKQNPARS